MDQKLRAKLEKIHEILDGCLTVHKPLDYGGYVHFRNTVFYITQALLGVLDFEDYDISGDLELCSYVLENKRRER